SGSFLFGLRGHGEAGHPPHAPVKPLVAAHLHPQLPTSSKNPTLPSKAHRFQFTLTERAYKAAVVAVRALNLSYKLSTYQADLCKDMATKPDPDVLDEITVIMDICNSGHGEINGDDGFGNLTAPSRRTRRLDYWHSWFCPIYESHKHSHKFEKINKACFPVASKPKVESADNRLGSTRNSGISPRMHSAVRRQRLCRTKSGAP
ncbi:hypothetical protein XENOCAPTIV_000499, partial [Xenoophorus captivus]